MDRIIGGGKHKIDYRHIIHTLVHKPGAFRRYVLREALFPSLDFRRASDALLSAGADQPDMEYVRILHLAVSDGEECVRAVLADCWRPPSFPGTRRARSARCAVSEHYGAGSEPLRSPPGRQHRRGVRMSAATTTRDETMELRLNALHLPSFLGQYIELAERAAAGQIWLFLRRRKRTLRTANAGRERQIETAYLCLACCRW